MSSPLAVGVFNDVELVVRGVAAMLAPYADRVRVVERDAGGQPSTRMDVALFDTFASRASTLEPACQPLALTRVGRHTYDLMTPDSRAGAHTGGLVSDVDTQPVPARRADADRDGLVVEEVTVRFGGIVALDEARLTARPGEITGLIGPNGAGKTTLFNCLTGIYRAQSGSVRWQGEQLLGLQPYQVASHGVSRTFQNLALFPRLTVRENVIVGLHRTRHSDWLSNAFRAPWVVKEEREAGARADDALAEVGLADVAGRPAIGLPYGTLKRVEIARAIAARPSLLLLDEPAAGLAHGEVDELMGLVREISARHGLTVVLVEHHMGLVMRLCDNITVLNFGRTIAEGKPAEIRADRAVIDAYLGGQS